MGKLCRYSKNLFHVAWDSILPYVFAEGRFLRDESNYPAVQENEPYALRQAGVSQPILTEVDRSLRSLFNLRKKAQKGT